MEVKDRVVWVTGASYGIGASLSIELAKHGAKLLLSARSKDRLDNTAKECLKYCSYVQVLPFDLADLASLPDVYSQARLLYPEIDILVNNAGLGQRAKALETSYDIASKIFHVNFWGAVELTKLVVPGMLARCSGQVVVISSVLGKFSAPKRSSYCASKHALHGWFEALREETYQQNLQVTMLLPGWVNSEISIHALESNGQPHAVNDQGQRKGMSSKDCARYMVKAIKKGKKEQLIGGYECFGVYLKRFFPGLLTYIIRKIGIG